MKYEPIPISDRMLPYLGWSMVLENQTMGYPLRRLLRDIETLSGKFPTRRLCWIENSLRKLKRRRRVLVFVMLNNEGELLQKCEDFGLDRL